MKGRWKSNVSLLLCCAIFAGALSACTEREEIPETGTELICPEGNDYKVPVEEIEMDRARLRDKVMGGWIGHVVGMGSGFEYVWDENGRPLIAIDEQYWEPQGQVCGGTLGGNPLRLGPYDKTYQRVFQGEVKSDDDILIDVFNQLIFEEYGPNLGYYEISNMWKKHKVNDSAGGEDARKLMDANDYIAPYVGQFAYGNTLYTATEPWIENETLGLLFPGMPVSAESMAEVFTTVTGDAYGLYLGKLCTIAYSYAMTEDSAPKALEKAFSHMEKSNMIYDAYQYVLECYEKDPKDWQTCARGLVERTQGENLMGYNEQIDLYVNAGYVFLGVIFGENDFEQSIKIAALAGYDGDCTTATVGGLVGAAQGFEGLPQKYRQYLNGDSVFVNDTTWFSNIGADFPARLTFDEITDLTMKNMEEQVIACKGSVDGDVFRIRKQSYEGKIQTQVENYGFEDQVTDPWQVEGPAELLLSGILHHGSYGGELYIQNPKEDVKAFQELELVPGDYYRAVLYVSAKISKEFRIYAEDSEHYMYASYNTPIIDSDRFIRTELLFCATSDHMKIGIHVPTQTSDSPSVYIDDLFLLNVSHQVARSGQCLEAELAEVTEQVTAVKDETASGNYAILLQNQDAVRFTVEGMEECFQNIRVYYDYKGAFTTTLQVMVDQEKNFQLPLLARGETSDFSAENYADFGMYLGEGEHEIVFRLVGDSQVEIDRIEVRAGDLSLRP